MHIDVARRTTRSVVGALKEHNVIFISTAASSATVTAAISAIYYSLLAFPKISLIGLAVVVFAAISISVITAMLAISRIKNTLKALGMPDDVVSDISTGALLMIAFTPALFAQVFMATNIADAITGAMMGAGMLILYYLFTVALLIRQRARPN